MKVLCWYKSIEKLTYKLAPTVETIFSFKRVWCLQKFCDSVGLIDKIDSFEKYRYNTAGHFSRVDIVWGTMKQALKGIPLL